ncbi:MAG: CsgG/HfaB family protein [Saprospiraceae bacterium]
MRSFNPDLIIFLLAVSGLLCSGCGAYLNQPMKSKPARMGEETQVLKSLRKLPPPQEKLVTAVYKFRDQTGQYKPMENGAGWSTAVTQGATNILIRALKESGWFVPIERENVGNLLNERKIIRSSRSQFLSEQEGQGQSELPPLLFAGMILEGGIVSYDANVMTGGAGIRYFGTGFSGQYRQDRVTVYLRAISVSSGEIVKTVYTSKTVLSQAVDGGMFKFVKFKRLLEVETGFTFNEPSELAVTEAIEKAVQILVLEGIRDNLWSTHPNAAKETQAALAAFQLEIEDMQNTDVLGRKMEERSDKVAIEAALSGLFYQGEYRGSVIKPGIEMGIHFYPKPGLAVKLNFGYSQLATEEYFRTNISYVELNGIWNWMPFDKIMPFAFAGIGMVGESNTAPMDFSALKYAKLNTGIGMEYRIGKLMSANLTFDNNFILSDRIDGMEHGKYNDYYWRAKIGVKVFINSGK